MKSLCGLIVVLGLVSSAVYLLFRPAEKRTTPISAPLSHSPTAHEPRACPPPSRCILTNHGKLASMHM